MTTRHAKIALTAPGRGTIHIDDHELTGVCAFTIDSTVKTMAKLTVDISLHTAEFEGDVIVTVPDRTWLTLLHLGWTPPTDDADRGITTEGQTR